MPLVRAYSAGESGRRGRSVSSARMFSAVPGDYLRTHGRSRTWAGRLQDGASERALFPGAAPIALAAVGMVPPLSAVRWTYLGGLLLAFDGSLGLNGVLYPTLHRWFAPLRNLRASARFSIVVGMSLAIFGGFGVRRLLDRCRSPRRRGLLFGALVAAVLVDARPALSLVEVWEEPPAIYEELARTPGAVLFELPVTRGTPDWFAENAPFMYFSIWHRRSLVNGYSGHLPASYGAIIRETQTFPAAEAVAALRRRGVTHVTVNCALLENTGCEPYLARLDAAPGLHPVAEIEWQRQRVRLYEVRP
jgi:hypothetical protein